MSNQPPEPLPEPDMPESDVQKNFMLVPVFLALIVGIVAMSLGILPNGMIGGLALLLPAALLLDRLGGMIPILKDWLGGSPLLLIFSGAGLVYAGLVPEQAITVCTDFMKGAFKTTDSAGQTIKTPGTVFLDFYICGLIVGAILGINPKLLVKAGARYAVPLAACIACCFAFAGAIAGITGYGNGWQDGIGMVALPILGGGMGGGAVPMNQVITQAIPTMGDKTIFSIFVPALAIGNVCAIIAAGLLDRLGKKYPHLSGNGEIMKDSTIENIEPKVVFNTWNIIVGISVAVGFYTLGHIISNLLLDYAGIKIHRLAIMIVLVAGCKICGLVPQYIIVASYSWFRFMIKAFTGVVLLAIGVVFTDLGDVLAAVTDPIFVLLCASVVIASIIGAGFAGRLVGFNFVESALTAGLCMANMGGTGDVAVLSACNRMNLMPFARFSTSIGGAFIILICGASATFFYGHLAPAPEESNQPTAIEASEVPGEPTENVPDTVNSAVESAPESAAESK